MQEKKMDDWERAVVTINRDKRPEDTLFVWGYLPGMFYRTGMLSPTRTIDSHQLEVSDSARKSFGDEIIRDISEQPPTFVVDLVKQNKVALKPIYERFRTILTRCYESIGTEGRLELYKVKKDSASGCTVVAKTE
jgi:hypothetical protein